MNIAETQPKAEFCISSELGIERFSNAKSAAREAAHQLRTGAPRVVWYANGEGSVRLQRLEELTQEIAKLLPYRAT
jgi:hypothetical protein